LGNADEADGRHASLPNFAFSAADVAMGVLGLFLMRRRLPATLAPASSRL
jgi:hypothetical protein